MEIGPYRLNDESTLRYNDGSWDEFANILFVDNPVGTGFSYVDTDSYVHELKEMADQMILFLKKFFEMFPEYEDNDVSVRVLKKRLFNANISNSFILLENPTQGNIYHIWLKLFSPTTMYLVSLKNGICLVFLSGTVGYRPSSNTTRTSLWLTMLV